MLAGSATITLRSLRTGARYTYKVRRVQDDKQQPMLQGIQPTVTNGKPPRWFVSLLSGPDNESDFVYLGMLEDNVFRLTRKSRMTKDSLPVRAFSWAWTRLVQGTMPLDLEIWHEGRCGRCGRKLTVPDSVQRGIGPECAAKMQSWF